MSLNQILLNTKFWVEMHSNEVLWELENSRFKDNTGFGFDIRKYKKSLPSFLNGWVLFV